MTCIVGLEAGGRVWIGGDSAGSDYASIAVRADTKVFTVGPYALGFTSSFRMGQLLRYQLQVGAPDGWDVDRFMATTFIDAVRACLADGGWIKKQESREAGGTFLVGVQGRLYEVYDDFQVARSARGYAAVGSGSLAGLGSLHTTGQSEAEPSARLLLALQAAGDLTCYVRPPFTIVEAS